MAYTPTTASVFRFEGNKCIGYVGESIEELVFPASYSIDQTTGLPIDGNEFEVTEIGNGTQSSINGTFSRVIIPNNIRKINYKGLSGSSVGELLITEIIFESNAVDELDPFWANLTSLSKITLSETVQGTIRIPGVPSYIYIGEKVTGLEMRTDAIKSFGLSTLNTARILSDGKTIEFADSVLIMTGMCENGRYESPADLTKLTTEMLNTMGLTAVVLNLDSAKANPVVPLKLTPAIGSLTFNVPEGETLTISQIKQSSGALKSITFQSVVEFTTEFGIKIGDPLLEPSPPIPDYGDGEHITVIPDSEYHIDVDGLEIITFTQPFNEDTFRDAVNVIGDGLLCPSIQAIYVPGTKVEDYKEVLYLYSYLIQPIPGTEKRGVTLKFPRDNQEYEGISVLKFEDKSGNQTLMFQEHNQVANMHAITKGLYFDSIVDFRGDLQTPTITKLHDGVFSYRESLESVTIPASVVEIGDEVFLNSHNLKMVKFMGPVPKFGARVFEGTHPDLLIYVQRTYESGYDNALKSEYGTEFEERLRTF